MSTKNPFAHHDKEVRLQAALALIEDRRAELADVEEQLAAKPGADRQLLLARRQALRNHIRGWEAYVKKGCPREARAQITAAYYKRRNLTTTV